MLLQAYYATRFPGNSVEFYNCGVAGDVAPVSAPDGVVNVADYLVAMRIVLGGIVPTATQLANGDLYPVGSPDGVINVSDLILLNKLILP